MSFKEFKEGMEKFISDVDRELKILTNYEKEVEKRYKIFETVIEEAEVSIAKELPFSKDFWLFEHNFIVSAEHQLKQQQKFANEVLNVWAKCT